MNKVISNLNPLPFLQQRISYAEKNTLDPIYFVENVPQRDDNLNKMFLDLNLNKNYCSSQGVSNLIEAIIDRTLVRYSLKIKHEQTLVTNGSTHALSLIFKMLRSEGGKVLCQGPVFIGIHDLLKRYNYSISYIPDDLSAEELSVFLKAQSDINFIYINIPNNPTGRIYSPHYIELILEFIRKNDTKLIADLVYDDFIFNRLTNDFVNPLNIMMDWRKVFAIYSLSKNWGLPGLRIGWITSDEINIINLTVLLSEGCVCINRFAQNVAEKAINMGNQNLIDKVVLGKIIIEQNWGTHSYIKINQPQGGTQFFAKFPVKDIEHFADYMLLKYGLVLATSSNYMMSDKSSIRIPLGYNEDFLEKSINLLNLGLVAYLNNE